MALNISEAHAVNRLADWLLPEATRGSHRPPATDDEAREALALLADKAHKALMAGITGDEVRRLRWAARDEPAPKPAPDGHRWADVTCVCEGTLTEQWRVAIPEPVPDDEDALRDAAWTALNDRGVAEFLSQTSEGEHDRVVIDVVVP